MKPFKTQQEAKIAQDFIDWARKKKDMQRESTAKLSRPLAVAGKVSIPKLFIALPEYGGQCYGENARGVELLSMSLQHSGMKSVTSRLGNESLIPRGRNVLVARFLKTDCTHLLFIDSDIGFIPRDVDMLIRGEFDVAVGAYPMKGMPWVNILEEARKPEATAESVEASAALYVINAKVADMASGEVKVLEKNGARFIEVEEGGTGFMLISRAAIERFISHYKKDIEYLADYGEARGETHHMVFQAERDPRAIARGDLPRYLSEDWWFCQKWQDMGGKVWMCLDCKLTHSGTYTFRGDVARLFTTYEPATAAKTDPAPAVEFVDP